MIAIHDTTGFAERWTAYCENNNIPYKLVNAYDNDIVSQVKDCDAFMWQIYQKSYKDKLFAKQLLFSLQMSGIRVFPDFNTAWHFDDKVGQKYLLESLNAPLVPSYVFYTKKEALQWIKKTDFPKVFKLRGGAGSENVKLVYNRRQAIKLAKKAFSSGFKQYRSISNLKDRWKRYIDGKLKRKDLFKGIVRLVFPPEFSTMIQAEKGYVYFQDFIPDNTFDVRVVIINDKAFALIRMTRKGDFRASGSGHIVYNKSEIDERCIRIAFDVNSKLKAQSVAYDFVFDSDNNPLIIEISYGYSVLAYDKCEGYWTADMQWHEGANFDFCGWMVENLIDK